MRPTAKSTDFTKKKELWKVFRKHRKELFAYTVRGEGKDEEEATISLLAYGESLQEKCHLCDVGNEVSDLMAGVTLYDYQLDAINRMKIGCILCGGVGSGKSRTSLAFYYKLYDGKVNTENYVRMTEPPDLYIITTARKRDTGEWDEELAHFYMSTDPEHDIYEHKVVVDSWNNIGKYVGVKNAFFIFDEQRVVGKGAWVKSFYKITQNNEWILLSATPGDCWTDYIPVFIANGFYRNRTDFNNQHVVYSQFCTKYPKIDRYLNTQRLVRLRERILVDMDFARPTVSHHENVFVDYDKVKYLSICKNRWNLWENKPIETASEFCYLLRKLVNADASRQEKVLDICKGRPRVIIFYNFDYELDILMGLDYGKDTEVAQWNGHKHQPLPEGDKWVYLVQYNAGAEGWNCIKTDTIIFYSQNYSYKIMEQASGRIDRLNTPYKDLYYYHLKSRAGIDLAISRALNSKKAFNERTFYGA